MRLVRKLCAQFISGYSLQPPPSHTPQNTIEIEALSNPNHPIRRVYQLQHGFIPIVTNHGSAILAKLSQQETSLNTKPRGTVKSNFIDVFTFTILICSFILAFNLCLMNCNSRLES